MLMNSLACPRWHSHRFYCFFVWLAHVKHRKITHTEKIKRHQCNSRCVPCFTLCWASFKYTWRCLWDCMPSVLLGHHEPSLTAAPPSLPFTSDILKGTRSLGLEVGFLLFFLEVLSSLYVKKLLTKTSYSLLYKPAQLRKLFNLIAYFDTSHFRV